MRKTRARSLPVMLLTLILFVGVGWFMVQLVIHSSEWAGMPQNEHTLNRSLSDDGAGTIRDRNGVVLAHSEGGKRLYNEDESVRCACLHIIGETDNYISNSVQNLYHDELTGMSGYNFITGFGLPEGLKPDKDITLTIDSKVQKAAYEAMGDRNGAVVIFNYKTGDILCMVSTRSYDPMNKPDDIEKNEKYKGVYLNRAISASYPPGSTFKLITAAAALENISGSADRTYFCTGSDVIGGGRVTCYDLNGSGEVNMKTALMHSCNCYFAQLSLELGSEKMTAQAEKCGFNKTISFDRFETVKSSFDMNGAADNDLAWAGVGQYRVLESPMNMAVVSSAIANNGTPVIPHLIAVCRGENVGELKYGDRMMEQSTAEELTEMMSYTVNEFYGRNVFSEGLDVCAKTGTAEVGDGIEPHGWITGFVRNEQMPVAFAVVVENGSSGYGAAVPVARAALGALMESQAQQ